MRNPGTERIVPLRVAWKAWRNKSELDHITGQLDAGFQRFSTPGQSFGNKR